MPEEMEQQEQGGKKKGGLFNIIKLVAIPLVISLVVSLAVFFVLGSNKQPSQEEQQQAEQAAPTQIKAVVITAGKYQTFMLKGGRDVVVVDSLTLLVGSEPCRAAVGEKNDEIMDALSTIFLSKERFDLVTPAGLDLLKKQIREAVNQITGFTGEKEKLGVLNVYIYIKAISTVQ
ncbi:MAG: flagellar basal body-associated FliL family protein [Fervidobacterium sp.]|uniref:Flagellar protein FliL n=1 Tax=Fervidobacterium gondwanense DSM 13020 TaxID=1121883 RepID=A0A1M7RUY2_FERGO|nr:flagellar basal body-associated FliL family protein [Fervidobacterium gondwanense]UXF01921.1 flagellar basal body protein FliL [Fervidobacterium riparium]SHN50020.1 flagellar FliL protein [Fervidobacterium gondwanense DSM 13020]